MKKKALLTLASFGLLASVIIYATIAWYTNIANVTGLTFDVAEYDFKVNYEPDNFIIQLDDYLNVTDDKAAPGTGGVIPIRLSADSDVGATYAINLDFSNMAPEFKERIRFFYFTKDANGNIVEHLLDGTTEDIIGEIPNRGDRTEYIYWEWMYTADITPILVAPYMEGNTLKWTNFSCMDDMTYEQIEAALVNWNSLKDRTEVTDKITRLQELGYMKSENDMKLTDEKFQALVTSVSGATPLKGRALKEQIEKDYTNAHDLFDTNLAFGEYNDTFTSSNGTTYVKTENNNIDGKGTSATLLAYQSAMEVTLLVSGAQAMPVRNDANTTLPTAGATVYITAAQRPAR